MSEISQELITLLQYLLPGFVAAWVFNGLTSYPPLPRFERVVQALILTLFVQAAAPGFDATLRSFDGVFASGWMAEGREVWASLFAAFLIGAVFARLANTDRLHAVLRRMRITRETSYPSEWFGAFNRPATWVVLHLTDGRRLYCWPFEWPSQFDRGHFLVEDPLWLGDEGTPASYGPDPPGPPESVPVRTATVQYMLIAAREVRWVEFMGPTQELKREQERVQPAGAEDSTDSGG